MRRPASSGGLYVADTTRCALLARPIETKGCEESVGDPHLYRVPGLEDPGEEDTDDTDDTDDTATPTAPAACGCASARSPLPLPALLLGLRRRRNAPAKRRS